MHPICGRDNLRGLGTSGQWLKLHFGGGGGGRTSVVAATAVSRWLHCSLQSVMFFSQVQRKIGKNKIPYNAIRLSWIYLWWLIYKMRHRARSIITCVVFKWPSWKNRRQAGKQGLILKYVRSVRGAHSSGGVEAGSWFQESVEKIESCRQLAVQHGQQRLCARARSLSTPTKTHYSAREEDEGGEGGSK